MSKKKSPHLIEKFYDRFGPAYNYIYGHLLEHEGRQVAVEMLAPKTKSKILEIGVGTGLSLPLIPHDCEITGIDLSESMLKEARKKIKKLRMTNVKVQKMNANNLSFADNSFDCVLALFVLSATSEPLNALKEMKRVCKRGGKIVIMNHFLSPNKYMAWLEKKGQPIGKYLGFDSAIDMNQIFADAGLKPYAVKRMNFFNHWTSVAIKNEK